MPRRTSQADRLQSGRRDRLVTIEQRSATDSADSTSGEPVETWTTLVADMPASRMDTAGSERFRSDQQSARFETEWEINWRDDMDPDLIDVPKLRRLIYQTRPYDIVACVEVGRRAGLRLQTLAGTRTA